ncbi:MAG: urea ABC transporter permease subunit UrtB [Rhodocyclaceae bacterium]|jgi:urea transport system permease protein|nr:urea ABC transporter permease subunit UrtB [Rhodocyclaceae bacterium]
MRHLLIALFCWLSLSAQAAVDPALLRQLASEESDDKIAAIQAIAADASPEALQVLQSLADGTLAAPDGGEIVLNNRIRSVLANALAGLRLFDASAAVRLAAAKELQTGAGLDMAPLLEKALAQESDAKIKALLAAAHAQANLASPDSSARLAAVKALGEFASPSARNLLLPLTKEEGEADVAVRAAAKEALKAAERRLALGEALGSAFTGLSLGSILLLAALGLAITYGVMGVINMAHGELLMIGAYATYAVQSLFRNYLPGFVDAYVLAAIPVAFFAAAAVGILLERTVIRHLYGRPLETLLATWGLSLILIQAARVLFGAQNVELANPAWMSGGVEPMPGLVLPWNRIAIVAFSLFVLLLVWLLMNRTRLGMFVRAVTQNRPMAGCVGVHTAKIDTLAFGLGAGIAGLGGVALSQIANVGPDMGQGYIVDSFMVVVLGGVGQLAGAVWAALGLGVVTKFLEGWAGAVIAKIVVLVFIIVFIQKRPQGLFALKGRFVE